MIEPLYYDQRRPTPAPEAIVGLRQFVGWKYGPKRPSGKQSKIPINPATGEKAKPDDPATWGTLEEALLHANEKGLNGIGFMFSSGDGFAGIDLDDCRGPQTGIIRPWAWKVIKGFSSYTEVSPSGTGVKIFVRGQLPEGRHRRDSIEGSVEMYDERRFFTITGDVLNGYETIQDRQEALEKLHTWVSTGSLQKTTREPREVVPVQADDQELVDKARAAGNGKKFRMLFDEGDISDYGSHSEADVALMAILAFWTGRDKNRMESIFSSSALGRRRKWIQRPDYRQRTVDLAASRCGQTYTPKPCADGEVHKMINEMKEFAATAPWTGRRGPRARWVFEGLMNTVCCVGKACADGAIVSESSRENALKSGTRRETSRNGFKYLEEMGVLKRIKKGKGRRADTYLVLIEGIRALHKKNKEALIERGIKPLHKEDPLYPPTVFICGALWSRLRDAAPESEKDFDRNGRKISKGAKYSFNSLGSFSALVMEKVAAFPGVTRNQLAGALRRDPKVIKRTLVTLVGGGFVVDEGGSYSMPDGIRDLLLDELSDSGCLDREKLLREKYNREQEGYEEYLREKRLAAVARECGVGEEPEPEADGHVEELERVENPKDAAVITDVNDPEQFKALAAMVRDGIACHRKESPPPRREPFKWPHDPDKFAFFFPERAEREAREKATRERATA